MGKRAPLIWALCIVLGCSPALAFAAAGNVDTPQALLEVSDTPEEQAADADDAALENLAANPAKGPSSLMDESEGDHAAGSSEEGAHADRAKSESSEEAGTLGESPNAAAEQTGASDLPESWIDPNPPVYHGATLNAKVFSVGDEIRVEGSFSDEDGIEASYNIRPIVKEPDASLGYQVWYSVYKTVTSETAPGMYEVVGFQVQDRKGYVTWFYDPSKVDGAHISQPYEPISLPDLSFEVRISADPNPPVYHGATLNAKVFSVGDEIRVEGSFSDEDGIEASYNIRPIVKEPDASLGYQVWYSVYKTVTSETAPGMYEVVGFQVQDRKGYVTWFYDPSKVDGAHISQPYEPISLPDLSFEVRISADPNPPVYHGATLNAKVFSVGDEIRVEGSFSDEDGIEASYNIRPIVKEPDASLGYQVWYSVYKTVTSETAPGMYEVVGFQVQDRKGYVTWFYDPSKVDGAHISQPYEPISLPDLCFLLGDKTKEKLYKVLEGNHQVYAKGSDEPLSIRFDDDLSDFVFATVDRAHLPESNYDLRSGSTIITLSSAYLDTLSSSTHELAAWYSDGGNGIATFTVAGEEPGTGDAGAIGQEGSPDDADGASSGSKQGLSASLAQTGDANISSLLYLIVLIALAYLLVSCVAARKDERGPEGGRRTR